MAESTDLNTFFYLIILIDAKQVNPRDSMYVWLAKMLERRMERRRYLWFWPSSNINLRGYSRNSPAV